jgi:ketosteroid isomerase-like protein
MTVTVQSQDEAQIGQLLAERDTAMRARDAERLVSRYAPEIVKSSSRRRCGTRVRKFTT